MRAHHFKGMLWNKADGRIESLTFVFTNGRQGSNFEGPQLCPPEGTYPFEPLVKTALPVDVHIA